MVSKSFLLTAETLWMAIVSGINNRNIILIRLLPVRILFVSTHPIFAHRNQKLTENSFLLAEIRFFL